MRPQLLLIFQQPLRLGQYSVGHSGLEIALKVVHYAPTLGKPPNRVRDNLLRL